MTQYLAVSSYPKCHLSFIKNFLILTVKITKMKLKLKKKRNLGRLPQDFPPMGTVVKNSPVNTVKQAWVLSLPQEDSTCHRATKPVHHEY